MKKLLLLAAVALIAVPAVAQNYNISTKKITGVDAEVNTVEATDLLSTDLIQVMRTGSRVSELVVASQLVNPTLDLIATNTLTKSDCGEVLLLNAATEFATTLPAPIAGCKIRFIVKAAPVGANYTIVTNTSANIIIGGINELEVDGGDDGPYSAVGDVITFVASAAVVGDYVELMSDGVSWYLHGQTNADGGATIGST